MSYTHACAQCLALTIDDTQAKDETEHTGGTH